MLHENILVNTSFIVKIWSWLNTKTNQYWKYTREFRMFINTSWSVQLKPNLNPQTDRHHREMMWFSHSKGIKRFIENTTSTFFTKINQNKTWSILFFFFFFTRDKNIVSNKKKMVTFDVFKVYIKALFW